MKITYITRKIHDVVAEPAVFEQTPVAPGKMIWKNSNLKSFKSSSLKLQNKTLSLATPRKFANSTGKIWGVATNPQNLNRQTNF